MAPPVQLRCLITGVRVNQALPYFLTLQVRSTRAYAPPSRGIKPMTMESNIATAAFGASFATRPLTPGPLSARPSPAPSPLPPGSSDA